jgi:tetratricopeptide (TPR) repeat protein
VPDVHPSIENFAAFLRGAPTPGQPQIIRHLLRDCGICRTRLNTMTWSKERLSRLLQVGVEQEASAEPAYDYSSAFAQADRAVSAFLAPEPLLEGVTPSLLLEELEALPVDAQRERVKTGRFTRPAFVRFLVDRSHAARYRDADEILRFANLAQLAAEGCPADLAGGELKLADLRSRAWGQYSNALRICGRPHDAGKALATAQEYRERGTGDPLLHAWLLERVTSLAIFQGSYKEAIEACDEAGRIYRSLDENHLLAGTMIQKAIATLYSGDAEQAVDLLNQAIPRIDDEADPHLLLAACHNLSCCYIDLDRPDQALVLYNEGRELYQAFGDSLIRFRATRQEGQLLRDLGHLRAAEVVLLRARKGYQELGLAYEMALVSLDLAGVYVRLGLVDEVKRTVLMTVPIFHALRVNLKTLAALLQLQQVADQEQQALALIRTLNSGIESLPKKSAR